MMPDVFDHSAASRLHYTRDLTNSLIAVFGFVKIVNYSAGYHDIECTVSERQLPHICGFHNNSFRNSLPARIFQCRFGPVAREILGLPDVYSGCPPGTQPFCGADKKQTAAAPDIEHLFLTRP
jgi:hypothetical protein